MTVQHGPDFVALVEKAKQQIQQITIAELQQLALPYILIDIREDNEWQRGHIVAAIHIGKGVIERDIEQQVPDKNQKIILYCGGGYRSALSAESLQKMGYQQVFSLDGGYRDWCLQDLPLQIPAKN